MLPVLFFLAYFVCLWSTGHGDAWVTISRPKWPIGSSTRLDICYVWGSQCGQPASNAYCKAAGYRGDTSSFSYEMDIGNSASTRVISSNALCDQGWCDGFLWVKCRRNSETFNNPRFGDRRVDWCLNWSVQCGQGAADKFCQSKGYSSASAFAMAADIGNTRLIGTGAVCDMDFCDGFTYIRCV